MKAEKMNTETECRDRCPVQSTESVHHLTTAEAAAYLRLSEGVLHQYRHRGQGPRYHQPAGPGGKVWYTREDLDEWLRGGAVEPGKMEPVGCRR